MLPKKYRFVLRNNSSFFLQAQRKHSHHFIVYSLPSPYRESQFASIVPAKKVPLAVQRHKIKRVVAEMVAKILKNSVQQSKPSFYVVYVKNQITDTTVTQLLHELEAMIQ